MIRSLHHVGITVPDLKAGEDFYTAFGLNSRECGNDLAFRPKQREQDQIRLIEGPHKRLSYISFTTNREGMETAKSRLANAGVALREAPFDIPFGGTWFQDPDDTWVHLQELEPAPVLAPAATAVNVHGNRQRVGIRAADTSSASKRAEPLRLGHLIKFTPDVPRATRFYTEVLGMKVSDQAADLLAFLRCSNGGDHHTLGLNKSSHTGVHHLSFEVGTLDEIELGARRLIEKGYTHGLGPGRHVAGSNFFHYIRDPWNGLAEYSWDMDVIPEDCDWTPLDSSPEGLLAVWMTAPPTEEFFINYEPRD